jgi:hypothetical protein
MIKSRRKRLAENAEHVGEKRNSYRALERNSEGKRQLGRARRTWEDNIEKDLGEIGWGGIGCNHLARIRTGGVLLCTR